VVDTGGWYKLCCPSSQLAKPDVLGAIYRVRKKGAAKLAGSARTAAYARLTQPPRLNNEDAVTALTQAGRNPGPQNRAAVVDALAGYRQTQDDRNAHRARAAAEGLARLRDKDAVSLILETIGYCVNDRILEQSLTRALIDIEAAASTRAGLKADKPGIQR